ncbi:Tfp pilus assembly protein FimT/FimU [Planctomycetota bacterium]
MLMSRLRRTRGGFTLVEVLAVTGIMAGLHSGGNYRYGISKANEIRGLQQLRQLYMLIQMQAMTSGFPKAAFYPKGDPLKDPTSIVRLVPGAPKELFLSPFAPEPLRQKGLTYAWNDTISGRPAGSLPGNTWMLIDLAAFIADPNVPRPRKFFVLYANGKVDAVTHPPPDIIKAVKAARAKAAKAKPSSKTKGSKSSKKTSSRDKKGVPKGLNKRIPGIGNLPIPPAVPGL